MTAASVASAAEEATFSATQTIPVPPASNYAGSGGGDGWDISLSSTEVYNVFHHSSSLTVACHRQSDASACWSPITVTDGNGRHFATSGHSGTHLDRASGRLFIFATRTADQSGGVVCFDTRSPQTSPFCGFTALTAAGEAPVSSNISAISGPTLVGDRWYAFSYFPGETTGGDRNRVLCFDVALQAPCTSQPYSVDLGSLPMQIGAYPPPAVAGIDGRVLIPYRTTAGDHIACFDDFTRFACDGSWPILLPSTYSSQYGAPFPLLNATGKTLGFCLPNGAKPCFDSQGLSVPTPSGMASAIRSSSGWNGSATAVGPRIYVPNGNYNSVDCYDAAAAATCSGFPKAFNGLSLLYTVNVDPDRPTCLWVNADNGAAQIQNFDAYSGGPCGQGPLRVLASSFVVDTPLCQPATYTSLAVQSPARASYSTGTVSFQDASGSSIAGGATADLDQSGVADLSGFNLTTALGLPHFLIVLEGAQGDPKEVTVKLTWKGTNEASCVKPGTIVDTNNPPAKPPIVLVHGIDWVGTSSANCNESYWGDFIKYLKDNGFSDRKIVTVGYYDGDTNCDADINSSWKPGLENAYFDGVGAHGIGNGHTKEAAIEHLGYHLAWWIYDNYSSRGVKVDLVGHSMGGLIARFALGKVDKGHDSFPPSLMIEDAITLGTPHGGARPKVLGSLCGARQCSQMRPGDGFLTSLEKDAWNPQGTGGTDWTALGSDDDRAVAADRAVGSSRNKKSDAYFGACHKVWYPKLEHGDYLHVGTAGPSQGRFVAYTSGGKCGAPLERRVFDLLSPVVQVAAALESSDY